jgi:hypothetical protein
MSTVTQLDRFRRLHRTAPTTKNVQQPPVARRSDLGALWNDMLATLALVTLASIVVYEALKIPL